MTKPTYADLAVAVKKIQSAPDNETKCATVEAFFLDDLVYIQRLCERFPPEALEEMAKDNTPLW